MAAFGALGGILFLLVGIVQIYVGYIGIEYHLGAGFAIGALAIGFVFRIMLPLTIGTFFGALDVWGWPWYGALALAAPGLLFIVPALVTAAISTLVEKKNANNYSRSFSTESSSYKSSDTLKNVTPKKKKKVKKKIAKKKNKLKKL
tara:strand:- start:423 stop:860 length:438 start_codon:yes stop_codon:yes gene_type:complete